MEKYFVMYLAPAAGLEAWAKTDPEVRKVEEEKMMNDWNQWMAAHKDAVTDATGLGKTKQVTTEGVTDTKNDMMLYSMVTAASQEEAATLFLDHPHLQIPGGSIQVMSMKSLA